jgi:uncharacterized protein (DUF2147 family)
VLLVKFAPVAFAVAFACLALPANAAVPVTGKWMTEDRDSVIEIGACGTAICGRVTRVLKMMPNGKTPVDANNPDPALRNRPVQGMMILSAFTDVGSVWHGKIYDPRSGKSYKSKLSRNPDGTLKVQGCIGFICKTFVWTPTK